MAKYLAQIILGGVQVVARAFARAVQQEVNASRQAGGGRQGARRAAADSLTGMSIQEAKQILNVSDVNDAETIQKNFQHLFETNEKSKGGSLYIQSKVYRAKERLDIELINQDQKQKNSSPES